MTDTTPQPRKRGRPRIDKENPDPQRVYSKETSLYRNQSWKPGPHCNDYLLNLRAEMVRKSIGLKQLSEGTEMTYAHLNKILRGAVPLTKIAEAKIRRFMDAHRFVETLKKPSGKK